MLVSSHRRNNQARYAGYLKSNVLWCGEMFGLSQYEINFINNIELTVPNKKLRLGLLVEQFIFASLRENKNIELLKTNLQIVQNKKTLGELDCLLLDKGKPIHLELVFKFYLYDPRISGNEIDKWIGPNRNDSLKQKLTKLKSQQMPLLHHPKSNEILNDFGYNSEVFVQKVHFKAQLFLPLGQSEQIIHEVNTACICGFYITRQELALFKHNEFFLPGKLDWLNDPHSDVLWLSYSEYSEVIEMELNKSKSPLCWMRDSKGKMTKFFVVFW